MSIHDDILELIPGYALDALEGPELERVRAHVTGCRSCRHVLQEYQSVAAQIAFAVPPVEPSRELKVRTMQRALERAPFALPRAQTPRQASWRPGLSWPVSLAGVAIVLALIALVWSVWQMAQLSQELAIQRDFTTVLAYAQGSVVGIHGTDGAPQADGKFYIDADANVAALITVNLPPLAPGQAYQAWLVDGQGHQASGGTFKVDSTGSGWLLVRAPRRLGEFSQVQVTVEPEGGSAVQTTRPVLAAALVTP